VTNPDFLTVTNDVQQRNFVTVTNDVQQGNMGGASVTTRIINGWHNSFSMSALGSTGISIANMQDHLYLFHRSLF